MEFLKGFVKMGDPIEDGNGSTSEPLLAESPSSRGFFGNLFDLDQYTVYKGCDICTLEAWRKPVFALNVVRRFRNVADLKKRRERQANIEVKLFALSVHFLIQTDEHFDATETTAPKFGMPQPARMLQSAPKPVETQIGTGKN